MEKYSSRDTPVKISEPAEAGKHPGSEAILTRMIGELPGATWTDIEIIDWLPGDDRLPVDYRFAVTPFGRVLVASTPKGVCYLGLVTGSDEEVFSDFNRRFGHADRAERQTSMQKQALDFLDGKRGGHIIFHLRGTPYQTAIWRRLTRIPYGKVVSYATLGGSARHARAAGTANGRNPVFWIVPCHRVVRSDGGFDRYFWGEDIKKRLLAWEFANSGD